LAANRWFPREGIKLSVEAGRLRAGSRQTGGSDRDDLGQPTPDPGRRTTQQ